MPVKKGEEPMEKVTIRLFVGDKDRVQAYYPTAGHNEVIRKLVRKHLKMLDAEAEKRIEQVEVAPHD